MGKRDDIKGRSTREFDSARLAAVMRERDLEAQQNAAPEAEPEAPTAPTDEEGISLGRTVTLDDPMTTGLLAEVARRSQTADFDEELVKEVLNKIDRGASSHPHTRRRSR